MPIYEYEHAEGACGEADHPNRFSKLQPMSADALTACPLCGRAVHRVISVPARPTRDILSASNLTEKGFTQYKRLDKGVYERTAGNEGPSRLELPPEE